MRSVYLACVSDACWLSQTGLSWAALSCSMCLFLIPSGVTRLPWTWSSPGDSRSARWQAETRKASWGIGSDPAVSSSKSQDQVPPLSQEELPGQVVRVGMQGQEKNWGLCCALQPCLCCWKYVHTFTELLSKVCSLERGLGFLAPSSEQNQMKVTICNFQG